MIDDASTDSTPRIIMEYAQLYPEIIKPIIHKVNQYNHGCSLFFDSFLPLASGEFVACCEGDDYWTYPGKLQRQVDFLRAHPDYSSCFHLHSIVDETHLHIPQPKIPLIRSRKCNVTDILYDAKIQLSTLMMRLDTYRHSTYFQRQRDEFSKEAFTDTLLYAHEFYNGKIYGFKGRWSVYRIHASGVSFYFRERNEWFDLKMRSFRKIEEFWPKRFRNLAKNYETHFRIRNELEKWTHNRRDGHTMSAISHLFKALRISPKQFFRIYSNTYL